MTQKNKMSTYTKGMEIRRQVLENKHVENAIKNTNKIDEKFQKFITEGAWGSVWSGDQLSKRDRSLITISLLAALGHYEELEMHFNASKNTGATYSDIAETLMHVAVYAGVPASNSAFKILKKVFQESK